MATETVRPQEELPVQSREADDFSALLKQSFKPRTERAATEVENAVKTLVDQALVDSSVIKTDVLDTIEEMIAQLDKKLSAQVNEILHAPEFQQIEGAWRGMHIWSSIRNRRDAQDSRDECFQNRIVPAFTAISQRCLGPERAVQEDL